MSYTYRALAMAAVAMLPMASFADEGSVTFAMRTGTYFNQYTDAPSSSTISWLNQHLWRMQTTSPYFDSRLPVYPEAWEYLDSYGVPPTSSIVSQHPDWILKDAYGNFLYIPFSCNGSTCAQYAADTGNPDYVDWWISNARTHLNRGYVGLWVDDVNLAFRVGNGAGTSVAPIDPRTGQPMTSDAWMQYMSSFMQQIRQAFPTKQIVHNSIWYAGGTSRDYNPNVIAEIQAADFINLERGISDPGLTGGYGSWSVSAFLAFIDHVHSLGKNVVYDEYAYNGEYSLAGYLLINTGKDCLGNHAASPDNWWNGYEVELGAAQGNRYMWNGLLRRDFGSGIVLLNPPQSASVTVSLPHSYNRIDGSSVTQVTLAAGQGAVLISTSPLLPVYINSGGAGTYPFVSDTFVTGGSTASFGGTVDVSKVSNPAPQAVYQSKRTTPKGTPMTYVIPALAPGHVYTVRLHFADDLSTAVGQRVFSVAVNGNPFLTNFDIFAAACKKLTAVVEQTSATADPNGEITVTLTAGPAGTALISGLEVTP